MKRAVVLVVSNTLEHHVTLVYRTIFLGETLALIEKAGDWIAEGHDTLIDDLSLTDIINIFKAQPDAVFICADVHHSPTARFVAETARAVAPNANIMAFGRATTFIPQYFARPPFTAVHESGDREAAIGDYIRYLDGQCMSPAGVRLVETGLYRVGRWTEPSEWAFPKLSVLPVEGYRQYVRKTYGAHYTPRISATVGKGCAWGCEYCGASIEEGKADRRRPYSEVMDWATEQPYLADGFSFHLYHPNLFADRSWIQSFAGEYSARGSKFAWRGVTTTVTLRDGALVRAAGQGGCDELAIGVETIDFDRGRAAKSSTDAIERAAKNCADAGISLKALVMAGYPGQSGKALVETREFLTGLGLSVRFTGYTPLQKLMTLSAKELDALCLERFDRRTYYDAESSMSNEDFFDALTRNGGYAFPDFEA